MISKAKIKFIKSLQLKKNRLRERLFIAEGHKVVGDLLTVMPAHTLVATEEWTATHEVPQTTALHIVSEDELQSVSLLQHPQQVLGLFPYPDVSDFDIPLTQLSLALDGIQDPGNLGTIIRMADWFGIAHIFCSPNTAEAYNPKVVQATMGSIAHVAIHYTELPPLLAALPHDFPIYGTMLDGENIYQKTLSPTGMIIMGNEGNGLSPETRAWVNQRLLIPNCSTATNKAESLNVAIATAIVCSEFRRQTFL